MASVTTHLPGLHRFLAVVQCGSLSRAAELLHLSQPALTKSIQVLEERLGAELFVREARGVTLTSYGKAVLARARLIDAEMHKLVDEVESLRDLSAGSVKVGAPPGAGFHTAILPAATLRLIAGSRKLSVNYAMGTREALLPLLRQGELDFFLGVIVEDETTGDLVQQALFDDRNCLIARAGHPLLRRKEVDVVALGKHPWFVMSEAVALERALRAEAREVQASLTRSVVRCDSSQLLKAAVLAGDGIGLTRYDVTLGDIRSGLVQELRLKGLKRAPQVLGQHTLGVIHRREAELSPAARQLITEIQVECRAQR